ncbi:dTDP-4-amino-4,6-dideoxygalactose transaminase [Breznakibacter xylanolyticus]|uniref:dTDP-4-amino-4,6-dideoxygalactose transaminase n=2 Tax=Breznakibacter xylanolyticus TaxID=990 RepID=A0A2W7P217_9BACT|nr:dTDP-4-amino-4,6-dideoxygalactose transaminase [Breznakibacter xylanolyticus]
MRPIQMVDIATQYSRLKTDIDRSIHQVLDRANFINGDEVQSFQEELADYLGVRHVITCANGTDALQVSLMALGLQPGDEVITSNFTFIATVEVIALLGLKPVLVDVCPDTFNMDVDALAKAITPRTRVIIPVHLFGQGAHMNEIMDIARRHQIYVVEDAAQATGAFYHHNRTISSRLGTIGDIGCTSFFPSKNLGCFGDGGACFTNDDNLAAVLRSIVNHGSKIKYVHDRIGVNSRLDTIQAAVLSVKLKHLDDFNQRRAMAAAIYNSRLAAIPQVQIPFVASDTSHIYHQYTVRVKDGSRDELRAVLQASGIPSMVYYPLPIHRQKAFEQWISPDVHFPVSDMLSKQVLSLPMHTELESEHLDFITSVIKNFYK